MPSYPAQSNPGSFVPTTNIWDPSELYTVDIDPQFRELLVRLYQNLNNMALVLNLKDSGYHVQTEFVTGQQLYPNTSLSSLTQQNPIYRSIFRLVVNFGALPNNTTKSVAHGLTITDGFSFTYIAAFASDPVGFSYIPIPYSSSNAADIIELDVDATNVNITTNSNKTAYTITYVILEYVKY